MLTNNFSSMIAEEIETSLNLSQNDVSTQAISSTANSQAKELIGANAASSDVRFGHIDGSQETVVVIDTGIQSNHIAFGNDSNNDGVADRIIYQYDFANNDYIADDTDSHGSHVAGIVGGSSSYSGIATGTNIIALKVFDDDGNTSDAILESALQWVHDNIDAYNIASVNLSLGTSANHNSNHSASLSDEINDIVADGVAVVAAAGNYYGYYDGRSGQGVSYPAADSDAWAVSASWAGDQGKATWASGTITSTVDNVTRADALMSFSQRSETLTDIVAPGFWTSAVNGGTSDFDTKGGTSMAAPVISGAVALAQQLVSEITDGSSMDVATLRSLMKSSAVSIFDGTTSNDSVINSNASYDRININGFLDAIYDHYNTATDGVDLLRGANGRDRFDGQDGADTMYGRDGHDILLGGDGSDMLFGGAGNDYISGGDGLDLSDNGAHIYRIYKTVLVRTPDEIGLETWTDIVDAGRSFTDLLNGFFQSSEFNIHFGGLNDAQFITQLYQTALQRGPDSIGLNSWLDYMNNGGTRNQLVLGFTQSQEMIDNTRFEIQNYVTNEVNSATYGQIYRLYQGALDRNPDYIGYDDWIDVLAGGNDLLTSAVGFINSQEFIDRFGRAGEVSNAQYVTLFYNNVLDREPDTVGFNGWVSFLENGGTTQQLLLAFTESMEAIGKYNDAHVDYMRNAYLNTQNIIDGGAGNDVVFGGAGSDTFVFTANASESDTVWGLQNWDNIRLEQFGYSSTADALAKMTVVGNDVVFADQAVNIIFKNSDMDVMNNVNYLFT